MEAVRMPFQGVINIVRFNWHFYVISLVAIILTFLAARYFDGLPVLYLIPAGIFATTVTSLLVSCYVYDLSGLYRLNWITTTGEECLIVNIHAGFDETSGLLQSRYPYAGLRVIDFYDPQKHTEVSIKRARKAYPGLPQTISAHADELPVDSASADKVFVIFSAHEIRDTSERTAFIKELARIIKPGGEIYITEHLRDTANFLAYNIGFFHFYPKRSWLKLFRQAGLKLDREARLTPYITTFMLSGNDHTY